MEISLRRATIEDVDILSKLEGQLSEAETYVKSSGKKDIEEEINNENYVVYVVEVDGEPAGDASYEMKSPDHAYVSDLMVVPKFQGKGVGKKVMTMILDELKDVPTIDLLTHPENAGAMKLYKSLGFKETGERIENYFGSGQPRIKLILENKN